MQPLLTAAELAAHLRVSVRHVERCAATGMPSIPVGARAKRYDLHSCLAWLAQHGVDLSNRTPARRAAPIASKKALANLTRASSRARLRAVPSG